MTCELREAISSRKAEVTYVIVREEDAVATSLENGLEVILGF